MTVPQALNSFDAAMHLGPSDLLIGLDADSREILKLYEAEPHPLHELAAFWSRKPGATSEVSLHSIDVRDRFGRRTACRSLPMENLPLTQEGDVDREQLSLYRGLKGWVDSSNPRTEEEYKIAQVWQTVLNLPAVSIDENFFEIGGHSLSATQVVSRLRELFQVDLTLRGLFEAPTIADLAKRIDTLRLAKGENGAAFDGRVEEREEIEL